MKQNFEENEGFVKIYWTIPELQYFFVDIPTKILINEWKWGKFGAISIFKTPLQILTN